MRSTHHTAQTRRESHETSALAVAPMSTGRSASPQDSRTVYGVEIGEPKRQIEVPEPLPQQEPEPVKEPAEPAPTKEPVPA